MALTDSGDTVTFSTSTPDDPCGALTWRIGYSDSEGNRYSEDVQHEPDADRDAVADGDVDYGDFVIFLGAYGKATGDPGYLGAADFDTSGRVDLIDYYEWYVCYQTHGF